MKSRAISLALGGGGARGLAHIGALLELEVANIAIERIVGVSMGSLVGAMYAFEPNAEAVERRALEYLNSDDFVAKQSHLFDLQKSHSRGEVTGWYEQLVRVLRRSQLAARAMSRPAFMNSTFLEHAVSRLLPDKDIAEAKIPLTICAVDLRSGRNLSITSGSVRQAVCGSASIPAIFPPVEFDGMLLSDIGVLSALPVHQARSSGPEPVVVVDVSPELPLLREHLSSIYVLMRLIEISEVATRKHCRELADLVITPDVGEIEWFDFTRSEFLIQLGRRAAVDGLQNWLQTKSNWVQNWFPS